MDKKGNELVVNPCAKKFRELVESAEKDVLISCPYIKQDVMIYLLPHAKEKRFRILTRGNANDMINNAFDLECVETALDHSFDVRAVSNLHAKAFVFDEKVAMITSSNLSKSGIENNLEMGIIINDKNFVEKEIVPMLESWWREAKIVDAGIVESIKDALSEATITREKLLEKMEKEGIVFPSVKVDGLGTHVIPGTTTEIIEIVPKRSIPKMPSGKKVKKGKVKPEPVKDEPNEEKEAKQPVPPVIKKCKKNTYKIICDAGTAGILITEISGMEKLGEKALVMFAIKDLYNDDLVTVKIMANPYDYRVKKLKEGKMNKFPWGDLRVPFQEGIQKYEDMVRQETKFNVKGVNEKEIEDLEQKMYENISDQGTTIKDAIALKMFSPMMTKVLLFNLHLKGDARGDIIIKFGSGDFKDLKEEIESILIVKKERAYGLNKFFMMMIHDTIKNATGGFKDELERLVQKTMISRKGYRNNRDWFKDYFRNERRCNCYWYDEYAFFYDLGAWGSKNDVFSDTRFLMCDKCFNVYSVPAKAFDTEGKYWWRTNDPSPDTS